MIFSYNYYKHLEKPIVYIAFPDRRIIGTLQVQNFTTDIMGNSADKGSFRVYKYINNEPSPYFEHIQSIAYD